MAESFNADILIVGAGTAGLVLAEELSRDSTLRIHVFEAGKDCTGHPDLQDVSDYTANMGTYRDWQFESVPQAGFNGRTTMQNSGKLLGGSSSINGGYYVAPSQSGVNAWAKLGNTTWSYKDLRQACLETVRIHAPDQTTCQDMGVCELQINSNGVSGSGPVQVTAKLQEHPITKAYFRALGDLGYQPTSTIFSDHSALAQILYITQDPSTMARSDANTAFGAVLKQRSNVTISFDSAVTKVILEGTPPHVLAKGVQVVLSDGTSRSFFASKEVILSAGSFNTPKLLELSGIGHSALLQKYQIPVVIDNPYIGERLRNHVMAAFHCELSTEVPAAATGIHAMAYMSSKDHPGLSQVLQQYAPRAGDDQAYDEEVRSIFLDPKEGSCLHFMGFSGVPNAVTFGVISAIPFSQGNTHITSAEAGDKPTIDPCFYSHPLDLEVMSHHLRTAATLSSRSALKAFFKIDSNSTAARLADADLEKAKEYLRENSLTTYHACGTASMRPREDGGVVDEQLKVYDTVNLRVVDASVIPLIAHGNTMAAVYGIAKLAAGMIKPTTNSG